MIIPTLIAVGVRLFRCVMGIVTMALLRRQRADDEALCVACCLPAVTRCPSKPDGKGIILEGGYW